jgi:hypothetical protein
METTPIANAAQELRQRFGSEVILPLQQWLSAYRSIKVIKQMASSSCLYSRARWKISNAALSICHVPWLLQNWNKTAAVANTRTHTHKHTHTHSCIRRGMCLLYMHECFLSHMRTHATHTHTWAEEEWCARAVATGLGHQAAWNPQPTGYVHVMFFWYIVSFPPVNTMNYKEALV